jgi:hypothetical protein
MRLGPDFMFNFWGPLSKAFLIFENQSKTMAFQCTQHGSYFKVFPTQKGQFYKLLTLKTTFRKTAQNVRNAFSKIF